MPLPRPAGEKILCSSTEKEKLEVMCLENIDQELKKKNQMIYAIEKNIKFLE